MKRSLYLALFSFILSVGTLSAVNAHAVSTLSLIPDGVSGSAAIQTQPLSSETFCVGSRIVVEFTTSGTGFDGTTTYSVELSDASGSFAAPTVLPQVAVPPGILQNNTYIYIEIPEAVAPGSGYRIRVVSSSPAIIGSDNGADLTITDDNSLTAPAITVNGAQQFCFGSATTYVVSSVTNGNLWFPGGTNTNPFVGVVLSGNYYTQITSPAGCATNSPAASIQVNPPVFGFLGYFENGQLASTSDTTVNVCEGDSLEIGVLIEGGSPPFDLVYTADGFNFEFINDVGVPFAENTFVYSTFVSDPGIYQLLAVTDAFVPPCNSQGTSGTVIVQQVPPPVTSFSYEPFCGSESGVPVAAPGFLGGGVYSFATVPTDGASVNASTGVISGAVIGNTYVIRYTVSEGLCTNVSSTASITVSSSDVVAFTINPFCEGADSNFPVTASGFEGGGTYSFNPAVSDGASVNPVTGVISGAAGATTYTVQYTSPSGVCQASSNTSVTTLDAPEISFSIVNSTCGNETGSVNATVTEGVSPYAFSWSNGATVEDISGLEAGAYTLTVTDAQSCSVESTASVINENQPELVLSTVDATCGSNNGSINLTINNGVGPFTILWAPGGQSTEDISNLSAGTYSVSVTDEGTTCEVNGSATILFQGAPSATFVSENSLCGQSVGSIDITVTGGTAPITHNWSNGATTEDLTNLIAGTYTDTITDANGCFTIVSVNILNENQFTLASSVVNPTCGNLNGGSIDLTVSGGDAPFTFEWSPNSTSVTEDVSGLPAGSYSVIVTDDAGCVDSLTSTLAPALPIELVGIVSDATCGNADGGINLSVTGGSGTYNFVWDNGTLTEDLSTVEAGTYSVVVSDQAEINCTATASYTVVNANQPEVSILTTNTSCSENTGTVSLTITGGSGNFEFSWTGPNGFTSNAEDLTALAAGTYSVTITDESTTCVVNESAELIQANAPTFTSNLVQTSCGQNNGIIDIEVTGGTLPFTITWNGNISSLDQINLSAGTYSFLLIDANNCQLSETFAISPSLSPALSSDFTNPTCGNDTGSVDITLTNAINPVVYSWTKDGAPFAGSEDIELLSVGTYILLATDAAGCAVSDTFTLINSNQATLSFTSTPTLCGASTGTIDLTVDGGTAPFNFEWSGSDGFSASTEDLSGLAGGCYSVTVTDASTCVVTLQACVVNSNAPIVTFNTIQPSCDENNGSVAPIVSGGLPPYAFAWSGTAFAVDSTIDNLGSGNYILTVTDANNCATTDSVTLINTGVPNVTANVDDPECGINDGSITALVSGGLAPYTYSWTPGGSTDATLSNLGIGEYSVLVTDAAGCEATGLFSLVNLNAPQITSTITNTECGESGGSINITVSGGSGDYSFAWTGSGVIANAEDQSNLAAGSYTILVTDNTTGCETTSTIEVENSNLPQLTLISVGTLCGANSGSVALTVTNANNPTFSWTGPNGFTATTEDISNLSTGIYSVTVTDGACEATGSVSVSPTKSVWSQNVSLVAGSQYNFQVFAQNVIASSPAQLRVFVGSANLGSFTPIGNVTWTPFSASFTATTSGLTEVKIVNENLSPSGNDFGIDDISLIQVCPAVPPPGSNCGTNIIVNGGFESGNTGFLSQYTFVPNGSANNELIPEGTYGIAANANTMHPQFQGTGRSGNFMIINGNEPENPVLSFSTVGATCSANNGSVNLTVTNFTIPISYAWTGPNGFVASSQDINGLAAGQYNVSVTSGACTQTGSATVGFTNLPTLALNAVPASCGSDNGSVDLTITGATNPTVAWAGPDGFTASTEDIANLSEGLYNVTVTSGNCVVEDSIAVAVDQPQLAFDITPSSCSGTDGSVDLTVTNASNPTFSWSGPDGFTATTEDISDLPEGEYVVTVTDGECVVEGTASVNSTAPVISFNTIQPSCNNDNGSIAPLISGGQAPYTFAWSGSILATDSLLENLSDGSYDLAVTDANGCEATASVTLNNTGVPSIIGTPSNPECGLDNGSITVSITGGALPYSILWTPNGSTDATISNLGVGTYTILVTDASGCETTSEFTLTNSNAPEIASVVSNSSCGESTGSIDITVTNGSDNYTYVWSGNGVVANTEDQNGLAAGFYTVLVTDTETGCEATSSIEIINGNAPLLSLISIGTLCGDNSGSINMTVTNAVNPTFTWTGPNGFTATTEDISGLSTGVYSVTVTDGDCEVTASATVSATKSVWSQNVNLVAGSQYDFQIFAQNVNPASPAQLRIYVGENSLGLFSPVGLAVWAEFSASFTATSTGLTEVKVVNESLASGGNDFGLDDISLIEVCPASPPPGSTCGTNIIVNGGFESGNTDFLSQYTFVANGPSNNELIPAGTYSVAPNAAQLHPQFTGTGRSGNFMVVNGNIPVNPVLSFATIGASCSENNGSINLSVTNLTNPVSYAWTGPDGFTATTQDINNLAGGTYNVIVNSGGCTQSGSATVTITNLPELASIVTPAGCQLSNGSIDLSITNATSPTISWSGPDGFTATTEDIANLAEGSYIVTVTQGTCVVSDTIEVITDEPTLSFVSQPTSCAASNGSIDLTIDNANNPTFSWIGPDGFTATTEDLSDLAEGTYTVTVTDGDCVVEGTATIGVDEPSLELTATSTSCGGNTGSIDLTVTDGVNPTFSWSGPDGFTATTEDLSGLAEGTYTVTVTDGACVVEGTATIEVDEPSLELTATSSSCGSNTGSIDLTVTDGVNPTFSWSGPDGFTATTEDLSGLAEGIYTVTVTDGACVVEGTATIEVDEPSLELTATSSSCGGNTGSIDLTVTDGVNPTFSWSGPAGFTATTEDLSGLAEGTYTVTVTNGSCVVEASATVDTNDPDLTFATTTPTCGASEGAVDLSVTNASAPSFSWTGPNGFTATTEDISGLAAGSYVVTVNEGTCEVIDSVTIVNSDGPTASIAASTETVCLGEDVELTITFTGTAPYTFTYTDGTTPITISGYDADQYVLTVNPTSTVTYTLTDLISDANPDCEGSFTVASVTISISSSPTAPSITAAGATEFCQGGSVVLTSSAGTGNVWNISGPDQFSQSITVTEAGSYFVTVINEFGCLDTSNVIDVDVLPTGVEVEFTDTTVCAGTSIQLVANGGDSYLWSPSVYLSTILSGTTTCTPFETTTYVVTSTNECGTGSDTVTVTVTPIASSNLGEDLTLCQNAPLTLSVPFEEGVTYNWGPLEAITGQSDSSVAVINTSASTAVILQTTNTNGCIFTDTVSINIEVPTEAFNISAEGSTTFCQGDSLVLQATTGNLVTWSNGLENFDAILVTESGDYYAVYNGSNCPVYSDTISVTVTPLPSASILAESGLTVCEGTCVTLLSADADNNAWNLADGTSSTEASINACVNGWYVLSRTIDACTASDSVFVTVLPQINEPVITLDGSDVICEGQSTSTLISSYATGNQWLLNGQPIQGATSNTLVISVGGTYSVQVNSAAGCSGTSATIEILQKSTDPIEISAADTVVCNDEQISILLSATPGFVSYTWFGNGEAGETYTATYLGEYSVVGINEDGCQSTDYITIVGNIPFEVEAVSPILYDDFNVSYAGAEDGSINVDVSGGSGIFTYSWSNGSTAEDLTGLSGGDYTLTVTDDQGCSIVSTVNVKEPGLIQLPNGFTPNGDGFNDFYVIRGIQGYEGNQMNVFNRWGSLVYSAKDYQNNWDGTSNDGNLLPDGTYFIVVNLNKEGFDNVQSSIDLKRN
ncbi:MAG: gliding motility-associated C-terminal domain-containing protein [Bacteroidia bacterium]